MHFVCIVVELGDSVNIVFHGKPSSVVQPYKHLFQRRLHIKFGFGRPRRFESNGYIYMYIAPWLGKITQSSKFVNEFHFSEFHGCMNSSVV